jgi:hypothetical protein
MYGIICIVVKTRQVVLYCRLVHPTPSPAPELSSQYISYVLRVNHNPSLVSLTGGPVLAPIREFTSKTHFNIAWTCIRVAVACISAEYENRQLLIDSRTYLMACERTAGVMNLRNLTTTDPRDEPSVFLTPFSTRMIWPPPKC